MWMQVVGYLAYLFLYWCAKLSFICVFFYFILFIYFYCNQPPWTEHLGSIISACICGLGCQAKRICSLISFCAAALSVLWGGETWLLALGFKCSLKGHMHICVNWQHWQPHPPFSASPLLNWWLVNARLSTWCRVYVEMPPPLPLPLSPGLILKKILGTASNMKSLFVSLGPVSHPLECGIGLMKWYFINNRSRGVLCTLL